MKFKLDENLPLDLGVLLRSRGHDAHSVFDEDLQGAPDSAIASACREEQRILLTLDLDFAHIKNYPPGNYHGIIVLRLAHQDKAAVINIFSRILTLLQTETIARRLWIVDNQRTRIIGDT